MLQLYGMFAIKKLTESYYSDMVLSKTIVILITYFILYFILTFPLIVFIKSVSYMYICIILHFWINLGFFQAKICPKTREPCAGKCSSAKGIIAKIKTPEGDWYMPNNLVKIDNYSQNNKQ